MLQFVCSFGISVLASALLTWRVRNVATRLGLAMAPPSARHVHVDPTPRLGGVAVFLTFISVFGFYLLFARQSWTATSTNSTLAKIVLLSVAFFAVGLIDDLKGL